MAQRVTITVPITGRTDVPEGTWEEPSPIETGATMRVSAARRGDELDLSAEYDTRVPYFEWAFHRLNRQTVRAHLRAKVTGETLKRPWFAAPDMFSGSQIRMVATISFLMAMAEYGSTLLNQTVDYVAKTYGATNAQLGVVSSLTRIGNLVVLVGGLLADRIGRRRLVLYSIGIVLACSALSAVAPTLATFGVLQVFVNGATNLALMVGLIAAVEEAPEDSRAYTIAIVGIATALGFVLAALLLPIADTGKNAWRVMYAIAALGFLFLPGASRNLTETRRFEALIDRNADTGRVGEVVDARYGGRFVIMCVTQFLLSFFLASQSQFTNRYLRDERSFSGSSILLLRAVTQSVPALVAGYLGGRLAESAGRRPTARIGYIVGACAMAVFFIRGGVVLWIALAIGTIGLALAGPSHGSFTTELFPTEVRGTAGAGLLIAGVIGSATGLLLTGFLSDPFGTVGRAVALTALGPILVAIFLIRYLPEARGRLLDDVSPSEV